MDEYGYSNFEPAVENFETEVLSPRKIANGKFALYKTPEGGLHMTLQLDGEEPKHFDIPPMMLKMFPGASQIFKGL